VSENLKNGLFRGEIFFSRKKNHPSEGQFFKNDKMCNSYESRSVSARAEMLGTLFDPCRLAYLAYTSND
jgi:hypothetical protein